MERRRELDAFREAFTIIEAERPKSAAEALDSESFERRVSLAYKLALDGEYENAYASLDGAYHQLILALKNLRDKETVNYDLKFASVAEEYSYEIRRYKSQEMMLQMFMAEHPPARETSAKLERYIASAKKQHESAQELASNQEFADALAAEENAVKELGKAMQLMGFYF